MTTRPGAASPWDEVPGPDGTVEMTMPGTTKRVKATPAEYQQAADSGPGVEFTTDWHWPPFSGKKVGGGGGGGASGGGGTKAPAYYPDDIINSEFMDLTDDQRAWVREELDRRSEGKPLKGAEYRAALRELAGEIPGLGKKTRGNKLFEEEDALGGTVDPLAQQMFFFQTIAPYLDKIRGDTASMVNPLYAEALQQLPAGAQSLAPMLKAMQGSGAQLQNSLAGAAAIAPSLDALMKNVTEQRQAQTKAWLAAQAPPAAAGGGMDLAALAQLVRGE